MPEYVDPTLIGIAFLIWPLTKSMLVMGAAAVHLWSRDERRIKAAQRILDTFGNSREVPE